MNNILRQEVEAKATYILGMKGGSIILCYKCGKL